MKNLITLFLVLILPIYGTAQSNENRQNQTNSILITPLGELLNSSKSSIYYRRILKNDSIKYLSLRIGTEIFNSIKHKHAIARDRKSSSRNIKLGLEMGKSIGKMVVYGGPEISYTASRISSATLFPNENAIFSTRSFIIEEWEAIDKTSTSIFSIIGFVGFKYKLTKSISIGAESAIGLGWYKSNQTFNPEIFSRVDEKYNGFIKDLAVNRFILLEYSF